MRGFWADDRCLLVLSVKMRFCRQTKLEAKFEVCRAIADVEIE